ncbi:MAG: 3'-5' exonuclease [Eubacteriales bacterium]|nr:3'-5' exonuclease [Eubacteriales bacterium]
MFERNEFDTYTAIDVETPNRYSRSICSIGLVHVEAAGEPQCRCYLVNPEDDFDGINISIHGIRPEDVECEPTLETIWPEIEPFFSGGLLLAHNALFDLPVMRRALERHGIYPEEPWRYLCTLEQSRRHIPKYAFGSHRLDALCEGLGIALENHHDALCDALACANLYEYLRARYGCAPSQIKIYPKDGQ